MLDPEQNSHFSDHYIEFPYDMSNVFWIVTANTVETIPPALLDRLEVIELSSYTDEEKLKIAQLHLLPKERKANGLTGKQLSLGAASIQHIIGTIPGSGVRNLERKIATVCRKAARKIVEDGLSRVSVTPAHLKDYLGPAIFLESDLRARSEVGVCTGLAWTSVGGELLKIEVVVCEGKGKLVLTGQLGDVMKESARRPLPTSVPGPRNWGWNRISMRKWISTSMCRKGPFPKMVLLRGLPCHGHGKCPDQTEGEGGPGHDRGKSPSPAMCCPSAA